MVHNQILVKIDTFDFGFVSLIHYKVDHVLWISEQQRLANCNWNLQMARDFQAHENHFDWHFSGLVGFAICSKDISLDYLGEQSGKCKEMIEKSLKIAERKQCVERQCAPR